MVHWIFVNRFRRVKLHSTRVDRRVGQAPLLGITADRPRLAARGGTGCPTAPSCVLPIRPMELAVTLIFGFTRKNVPILCGDSLLTRSAVYPTTLRLPASGPLHAAISENRHGGELRRAIAGRPHWPIKIRNIVAGSHLDCEAVDCCLARAHSDHNAFDSQWSTLESTDNSCIYSTVASSVCG
jgi:hypothetical protein